MKLWRRAPNAVPKGILDKWSQIAYPMTVKTFLHLGAKQIKIISKDLQQDSKLNYQQNRRAPQILILGLPAIPALFSHILHHFTK